MGRVATVSFTATIVLLGINPYVLVSAARARRLKPGWRRPLPVLARVNGRPVRAPWRINLMPAGDGSFYLYLHGDVRRASGTRVGDRVRVELDFDHAYRPGPQRLPRWLAGPLRADSQAFAAWERLTPSRQKEILRYLTYLKTAAARDRNVRAVVTRLAAAGGRRPSRVQRGA